MSDRGSGLRGWLAASLAWAHICAMRSILLPIALLLLPANPSAAQTPPEADVSMEQLQADVERLVAFGTRHTLSAQNDPDRGIGAALDWGAAQFAAISAGCGGCLEVVQPERIISGD